MVNALKVTSVTSVPTMDAKNFNGEFGGILPIVLVKDLQPVSSKS